MDRTRHQPISTPEAPPTPAQVREVLQRMDILAKAPLWKLPSTIQGWMQPKEKK